MASRLTSGTPLINVFDSVSCGTNSDTFLEEMKIPNHITANKTYYVDASSGSDTMTDEDHGISEAKAFKTIQACINYVTTYVHMDRFNVTIQLSGVFDITSTIQLYQYATGSGHIIIKGKDDSVVIRGSNISLIRLAENSKYEFRQIKFQLEITSGSASRQICSIPRFAYLITTNCQYTVICNNASATSEVTMLYFTHGQGDMTDCIFIANETRTNSKIDLATTDSNSKIQFIGTCTVDGYYRTVLTAVGNSYINASGKWTGAATGKRYACVYGSGIRADNKGTEWIPGSTAGTIDVEAGCWYK